MIHGCGRQNTLQNLHPDPGSEMLRLDAVSCHVRSVRNRYRQRSWVRSNCLRGCSADIVVAGKQGRDPEPADGTLRRHAKLRI